MYSWNTYDYGFRGYYAPLGRFTSIDPLAEQTPWQSPYAYANNNFINNIDWMGLGGMNGFSHSGDVCQYIVIDAEGYMLGGVNDGDDTIYMDWDGVWDEKDGKEDLFPVGSYFWGHTHSWYMKQWKSAKARGEKFRAPGIYDGQYFISISANIGIQVFIPTPIGELGANIFSYEIVSGTIDNNAELNIDYFGKGGDARISTLQFSLGLISTKYSIKHKLLGNMRYVDGSNTSSISVGIFSIDVNGSFSLSYSLALFLGYEISITGNAFYGSN